MKLKSKNLTKDYPGCRALDNVSIQMESGKCYALLGKNGSGKSTFVKTFAGVIQPTNGKLYLDDEEVVFKTPIEAQKKGMVTVYQEMSLLPGLTVAENIFLNRMPKKGKIIDWNTAFHKAGELLKIMDVKINPKEKVMNLSMWQKQIVEITKAMSLEPKLLMLDEPTSALAQSEVNNLHKVVNRIKKNTDIIIIYITHKLQEIKAVADEVVVLRDGKLIGQSSMENLDHNKIIEMMFGKVEHKVRPLLKSKQNEPILEVKGLSDEDHYNDVSFVLHKGDVLGIAGMLGAGRTELVRGIFGAEPPIAGEIFVEGKKIKRPNPMKMKAAGLGLTPEERKKEALILMHSVQDNLCYASWGGELGSFIENKEKRVQMAETQIKNLEIKVPSIKTKCASLSGGNQQKVVVGNWLNNKPKIMIYDEPSRGIDVNAKQQIFDIMYNEAKKGLSTIFISSELEELLEVCNRIIIMKEGKLIGEIDPEKCSSNDLYAFAMSGEIDEEKKLKTINGGKVNE